MALPCETVRPQRRAIAMGVYFTCFYGGMGVLLPMAGFARDLTGSAATPLWFAGALLLIAIAMLLFFRALQSHAASASTDCGPPGHAITTERAHTLLMTWSLPLSPAGARNKATCRPIAGSGRLGR